MPRLIRSASLTNFAEVARKVGLDPARMLSKFGLPQRCLQDPELDVPIDKVRQLLEVSAERSNVEAFGLLMAETRQLSNLGPVGLLVREQPTARLAIEAFATAHKDMPGAEMWILGSGPEREASSNGMAKRCSPESTARIRTGSNS